MYSVRSDQIQKNNNYRLLDAWSGYFSIQWRSWMTEEVELRQSLLNHSVLQQGCELVYEFQRMIHKRDTNKFADWLQACEKSKIPEFMNLATGMKKDNDAIKAALSSRME